MRCLTFPKYPTWQFGCKTSINSNYLYPLKKKIEKRSPALNLSPPSAIASGTAIRAIARSKVLDAIARISSTQYLNALSVARLKLIEGFVARLKLHRLSLKNNRAR